MRTKEYKDFWKNVQKQEQKEINQAIKRLMDIAKIAAIPMKTKTDWDKVIAEATKKINDRVAQFEKEFTVVTGNDEERNLLCWFVSNNHYWNEADWRGIIEIRNDGYVVSFMTRSGIFDWQNKRFESLDDAIKFAKEEILRKNQQFFYDCRKNGIMDFLIKSLQLPDDCQLLEVSGYTSGNWFLYYQKDGKKISFSITSNKLIAGGNDFYTKNWNIEELVDIFKQIETKMETI